MSTNRENSRNRYLEDVWRRGFPTASRFLTSLKEVTPRESFVTCGRIQSVTESLLFLTSDGCLKSFSCQGELAVILREGDIVEVSGDVELKILEFKLLVPTLNSSPFPGLRFEHRRAVDWQKFLKAVRDFFTHKNFLELRTPTLVSSPGLEPYLDPFKTVFKFGSRVENFYLPTSPEFHLKKALTLGFERCFEFKECFRNGELSETHQPEFLMLEWYRAYTDLGALMADLTELVPVLEREFEIPLAPPVKILKMEELWKNELGFALSPSSQLEDLKGLALRLGTHSESEGLDFDDLFTRIFVDHLEPVLAKAPGPVILWHYPPSQAALARLTDDGWADRFEFYWKGFEIANAFHELNDPDEQKKRFLADQQKKKELGKEVVPFDAEFMKALEWGMPPSAGIALGLERLFMALMNLKDLADVRLFPLRPS